MKKNKPIKKIRHLKNDKVFKNFFKNNQKPLISLLESFLPLPKSRKIKEVKVLDSLLSDAGKLSNKKESVMDLRLRLDNNEFVNVEMQLHNHRSFITRMFFYGFRNYSSQLHEGDEYKELYPSYSLVFCDFDLFKDDEDKKRFYRSCSFREDHFPHRVVSQDFRVIFVELTKCEKNIENLLDFRQAWCYVLNHLPEMGEEDIKRFASKNKQMEELMDWTRPLTAEESDLIIAEAMEKQRRDRVAQDEFVFEQGMEKGLEKGLEKGMKTVALNMLNEKVDLAVISKVTGLSIEELKKLKK